MTKEEFIKKWATDLLEKVGLTEALSQQLDAEFKLDLKTVIAHENKKLWREILRFIQKRGWS